MNLERYSKRLSLGGASLLALVSFACTKAESTIAQTPTPAQPPAVTKEVVPPTLIAEPTATPKPEPTPIPEPTATQELPRLLRETDVYGVYVGDLFRIEGGNKVIKGEVLLSRLPNDSFLVAYTIKAPCPNGVRRAPTFGVPKDRIRGVGFTVDNIQTQMTPSLMSPDAIGGSLKVKDITFPEGTVCKGEDGLAIDARLKSVGKDNLLSEYKALHQRFGTNLTPDDVKRHLEMVYRGPLPDFPPK